MNALLSFAAGIIAAAMIYGACIIFLVLKADFNTWQERQRFYDDYQRRQSEQ